MNAVELLLKMDKGKVQTVPTKQVEVTRLSEIAGEPFIVTLQAVSGDKWNDIAETIGVSAGNYKNSKHLLLSGMVDPKLSDHKLQEKWDAVTPLDLMERLFTAGEIMNLAAEVTDLSGLGENAVAEVKN